MAEGFTIKANACQCPCQKRGSKSNRRPNPDVPGQSTTDFFYDITHWTTSGEVESVHTVNVTWTGSRFNTERTA